MSEVENTDTKLKPIVLKDLTKYKFIIPYYQRGYRWSSENVELLLNDLCKFLDSTDRVYFMQPLAVTKGKEDNEYEVIDGQQRLTTFYILRKFLETYIEDKNWYKFEYKKDDKNKNEDNTANLLEGKLKLLLTEEDKEKVQDINEFYIRNAYTTIYKWFENNKNNFTRFSNLLTATEDNEQTVEKSDHIIKFLWYEVDTKDSHKVFQNINSNKIQLTNSDLIKALLLSEESRLDNKYQIAAQFEEMERQFADGKFWYTFSNQDVRTDKGQSRIDLLFNLTKGIKDLKDAEYVNNPRTTFYSMMNLDKNKLQETWNDIRQKFQIMKDLYSNVIFYHYIGYLRYANPSFDLSYYLERYTEINKKDFKNELKNDIAKTLASSDIDDYRYDMDKKSLRKLFLLHNVETIIQTYNNLTSRVDYYYEYFPFELLYKQNWNIEHIDSKTLGDLKKYKEEEIWLRSVLNDYKEYISNIINDIVTDNKVYCDGKVDDEFLVSYLLENNGKFENFYYKLNSYLRNQKIDFETDEDKNQIGNLVLLDEHTNKSFHNSVFPTKRNIVLKACGVLKDGEIEHPFIPICTKDIYTKAYNTSNNLKLNCWTKEDADFYKNDISMKLKYYFDLKEESEKKN